LNTEAVALKCGARVGDDDVVTNAIRQISSTWPTCVAPIMTKAGVSVQRLTSPRGDGLARTEALGHPAGIGSWRRIGAAAGRKRREHGKRRRAAR
jgi:hypothetical protein